MGPTSILIVDDEANIRLMVRTALESEGYTLLEAADGREALTIIEREQPDLVVLDLSMPVLDGLGMLKEMKRLKLQRVPRVIVLTAYGSIAAAVTATRFGAADFLEKPVMPGELRSAVKAALEAPITMPGAAGEDHLAGGRDEVLRRVCDAMRMSRFTDAETLLMKVANLAQNDPFYFNLLGVLYETEQEWALAKKFYGRAMSIDKHYAPPQHNMQRIYELETFGRSNKLVYLGDETEARLADLVRHK